MKSKIYLMVDEALNDMTISLITAKELWDRLEQTYECKGIH
jgi:hypothetical protein